MYRLVCQVDENIQKQVTKQVTTTKPKKTKNKIAKTKKNHHSNVEKQNPTHTGTIAHYKTYK